MRLRSFGLFWRVPLYKAVRLTEEHTSWRHYWYGIVVGQMGIGVLRRVRHSERQHVINTEAEPDISLCWCGKVHMWSMDATAPPPTRAERGLKP